MKKVKIFAILFFFIVAISCTTVYASSSVTYFDGKATIIEDTNNNIQILSNEITINTDTSKVINELILKNTSNEDIITKLTLPLENVELSTSIHDLTIVVNGVKVKYTKENDGDYIFSTKIPAGTGKRVEVSYYTDNDLRDAKVIKYNFDNFKGKKIGKLKVDIVLNEKDVPLVKAIYPGHYTYDQNVITVEYYDMDVNTITKDIIVNKETYKNLKYGRERELTEYDKKVLDNVDILFEGNIFEGRQDEDLYDIVKKYLNVKWLTYYGDDRDTSNQIIDYIIYKEAIKRGEYSYHSPSDTDPILLYETMRKYSDKFTIESTEVFDLFSDEDIRNLADKKICVDFVETVDNKELYVEQFTGYDHDKGERIYGFFPVTERKVLKTRPPYDISRLLFEKTIILDEGITGEKLGATEEEKISYLNSINADLYIRVELYEGKFDGDDYLGKIGYYREEDKALAMAFCEDFRKVFYPPSEEEINKIFVKLSNEYLSNNCEIPTVVQFIGYLNEKDGKNIVELWDSNFYGVDRRGIATAYNVIQTEEAQRQLKINKTNNANKRTQALKNLKSVEYVGNEQAIQQELLALKQQEEQLQQSQINNNVKNNVNNTQTREEKSTTKTGLETKDIIIFSSIGVAAVICIVILVLEGKKRKLV